jgi:hypothetical protein
MTCWEYALMQWEGRIGKRLRVDFSTSDAWTGLGSAVLPVLGRLGSEGWELVTVAHPGGDNPPAWWFKRRTT